MVGAGGGNGTGIADRDQVTGTVRETRPSGNLEYPVTGLVRVNGQLVLEASTTKNNDPLRVFNWSSTANAGVTTMSGAFTKLEPYRTSFNELYTIRTEHEFSGLTRTP